MFKREKKDYRIRYKPRAEVVQEYHALLKALSLRGGFSSANESFATLQVGNGEFVVGMYDTGSKKAKTPCFIYVEFNIPTTSWAIEKMISFANMILQKSPEVNILYSDDADENTPGRKNYNKGHTDKVFVIDEKKMQIGTSNFVNHEALQKLEVELARSQGKLDRGKPYHKRTDYDHIYNQL